MMLDSAAAWAQATAELARAVRGTRSQVAFSRRAGYRSNVAAAWEGGHRAPAAAELLRAMTRVGIDVGEGFRRFHPDSAPTAERGLASWLDAQRGSTPQGHVAARAGCSRHQVRRWLSGEAEPRVPDFLRLLHALTGRAPDWVAAFVPIEQVPTLHGPWRAARTAARLAYDAPWSAAVRIVIDTDAYRADPTDAWLARALGLTPDELDRAVQALLDAGLAARRGTRLETISAFTADAAASPDDTRRLKAHWAKFAADRLASPRDDDLVSLNLVTLSRADLARLHELQRGYFRELRGLVASSQPEETAALVLMHVISLA
jgi:transcriptional regulator with XRE-family HTH domain